MVDVRKLKSRMALMGYTQKTLAAEMTVKGLKISENTLSSKMRNPRKFDCDEADVICDILEVESPQKKAEIFLA
jgi:hypothetical protein